MSPAVPVVLDATSKSSPLGLVLVKALTTFAHEANNLQVFYDWAARNTWSIVVWIRLLLKCVVAMGQHRSVLGKGMRGLWGWAWVGVISIHQEQRMKQWTPIILHGN